MKNLSNLAVIAFSAVALWPANGLAAAVDGAHHQCAMAAAKAEKEAERSHLRHDPRHEGHASGKKVSLAAAIKSAMDKEGGCRLSKAGRVCPMAGKSILRHGPCCAEECRQAPPVGQEQTILNITQGAAIEALPVGHAPSAQKSVRTIHSAGHFVSRTDSPEPRPPTA